MVLVVEMQIFTHRSQLMNWSVSIPIMSPTVMMATVTTFENHGASLYSLHCAKMYSSRSSVNDNSY